MTENESHQTLGSDYQSFYHYHLYWVQMQTAVTGDSHSMQLLLIALTIKRQIK